MSETMLEAQMLFDGPDQAGRTLAELRTADEWCVEEGMLEDTFLRVRLIGGSATFDPDAVIARLRSTKPRVLTVDLFDDQTGATGRLAWKGGRKCATSTAFNTLAAEVPSFAAAAAIEGRSLAKLKTALANGANPNALVDGTTLLYMALEYECSAGLIETLLKAGADANRPNADTGGETTGKLPLPRACEHASLAVVRAMLGAGADVNAAEAGGTTALHAAAKKDARLVRLLLESGADVSAVDEDGFTAFLHGVAWGYSGSAVQALLDAGSDVEHTCNRGGNARWYAVDRAVRKIVAPFDLPLLRPDGAYDSKHALPLAVAVQHKDAEKFAEHIQHADEELRDEAAVWLFNYEEFDYKFARECLPHVGYRGLANLVTSAVCHALHYPGQTDATQRRIQALIAEVRPDVIEQLAIVNESIVTAMPAQARRILEAADSGAALDAEHADAKLLRNAYAARNVPSIRVALEAIADGAELVGGCVTAIGGSLYLKAAPKQATVKFSRDGQAWVIEWIET